jgi:hypothetical protein
VQKGEGDEEKGFRREKEKGKRDRREEGRTHSE